MGAGESKCEKDKNNDGAVPTVNENKIAQLERYILLKSTILTCVLYGVPALILIIATLLSEQFKEILYDNLLPFVITFIVGAIFVILYLSNNIANFKITSIKKDAEYEEASKKIICPDYWKVKYVDDAIDGFKYHCVMDTNIIDKKNTYLKNDKIKLTNISAKTDDILSTTDDKATIRTAKRNSWTSAIDSNNDDNHLYRNLQDTDGLSDIIGLNNTELSDFKDYAMKMNNYDVSSGTYSVITANKIYSTFNTPYIGSSSSVNNILAGTKSTQAEIPLVCDRVFPQYLQDKDKLYNETNRDVTNKYTCAYAKACQINWSDAKCT